jgi:phage baseplate assembly protein W
MSIYGTDLKIITGELQIAANGEALLVDDVDTVIQDIVLRLGTPYGTLFYDRTYGSYVMDFVKEEDSADTRFALCDEIARRVEADPRVITGSPTAEIATWTANSVTVMLSFSLRTVDTPFNLVLAIDKKTGEMQLI